MQRDQLAGARRSRHRETDLEPVSAGALFRSPRSWGSYGSDAHVLLRRTRRSTPAPAPLRVPGRGWRVVAFSPASAAVSGCPASGTGLGAEFASHLKVARNWDPPNPRALERSAGAVRPRRGRGEVREANACPLKWRYVCDLRLAAFRRVAVQFRKVKEWVEATKMLGQGEEKREEFWTPAFQGSSVASPHAAFSPR